MLFKLFCAARCKPEPLAMEEPLLGNKRFHARAGCICSKWRVDQWRAYVLKAETFLKRKPKWGTRQQSLQFLPKGSTDRRVAVRKLRWLKKWLRRVNGDVLYLTDLQVH